MERFYTIQGEGSFSGAPAYFIRLGGCDVGCFWCDVKESWDPDAHSRFTAEELAEEVASSGSSIAVITGGEPAMHSLTDLTRIIKNLGVRTHIETSGAHAITGDWNWVTLSPKKFKAPLPQAYALANELKMIVYNRHDLEFAEQEAAKVRPECLLYLQPEWDRREDAIPQILNYLRDNPRWRLSLQTHKYIGVP